jgi:hypothetical protein
VEVGMLTRADFEKLDLHHSAKRQAIDEERSRSGYEAVGNAKIKIGAYRRKKPEIRKNDAQLVPESIRDDSEALIRLVSAAWERIEEIDRQRLQAEWKPSGGRYL